jgi:hypothetical protein
MHTVRFGAKTQSPPLTLQSVLAAFMAHVAPLVPSCAPVHLASASWQPAAVSQLAVAEMAFVNLQSPPLTLQPMPSALSAQGTPKIETTTDQ